MTYELQVYSTYGWTTITSTEDLNDRIFKALVDNYKKRRSTIWRVVQITTIESSTPPTKGRLA